MPSLLNEPWSSFEEILERLHRDGVYLHAEQLATFLLMHGLPVDLCYVSDRLRPKAELINRHYQGNMARLEDLPPLSTGYAFSTEYAISSTQTTEISHN